MGLGRIPGPWGLGTSYGCVYRRGPLGFDPDELWDDGPHFTPGVLGTGGDLAARQVQATTSNADEDELKLMTRVFGALLNAKGNRAYSSRKGKKTVYLVDDYVKDRDTYVAAGSAYTEYLAKCREELDANDAVLRKYIEPPVAVRNKHADWQQAQDVFYAWVRKAYEKELGADADVGKLIRAQMSEKLKKAVSQVKSDYGQKFQYGGFNPRPMKKHGYRMGTISEHAMGNAIDIDAEHNPHLLAREWAALLSFTGKTADHSATTWKTSPKLVYDGIRAVSDAWVSQLAKAMKTAEDQALKAAEAAKLAPAAPGAKPKPAATPLALALAADKDLKILGAPFIAKWPQGFLALPWSLVKELHEEGFLWGATFSDLDLHHFEL